MERIGYVKVREINVKILERFYDYLRNTYIYARHKPLSSTTIRSYYNLINNMLDYAVKCDYIKTNPNSKRDRPKKSKKIYLSILLKK